MQWTKKKFYINNHEIGLGRLVFTLIVTLFQFVGLWADNNWVLYGGMFYLFASALLTLCKSTKDIDEQIKKLEEQIIKLHISENELVNVVNGIKTKLEEGKTVAEIIDEIKNS